jgi:hypothetical protein
VVIMCIYLDQNHFVWSCHMFLAWIWKEYFFWFPIFILLWNGSLLYLVQGNAGMFVV